MSWRTYLQTDYDFTCDWCEGKWRCPTSRDASMESICVSNHSVSEKTLHLCNDCVGKAPKVLSDWIGGR